MTLKTTVLGGPNTQEVNHEFRGYLMEKIDEIFDGTEEGSWI